jgi:GNAT superfamily N-acetyltransferase
MEPPTPTVVGPMKEKGGSPAAAVNVRRATREDAASLLRLITRLAEFEKLPPPDEAARERLVRDLFGPAPRLEAYLAEELTLPVGYALVFETYSSFLALPTLYLEDLFVLPEHRSRKVGQALFSAVASEALRRGCGRMEWVVLDWNRGAIEFYRRLGATHMKEWQLYRLTRAEMETMRAGAGS